MITGGKVAVVFFFWVFILSVLGAFIAGVWAFSVPPVAGKRVCVEAGLMVETPIGISMQQAYWCGTDLRMTNAPDAEVVAPFSKEEMN